MNSDDREGDSPYSPHTEPHSCTDVSPCTCATMAHQPHSTVLTINTEVSEAHKCCTEMRHYKLTLIINYTLSDHQTDQEVDEEVWVI